jgi:hypothetical protein
MRSDATTVDDYLESLPVDRRIAIEQVRETILVNLPDGYREVMNWGMISYEVPLETYLDTYNGRPLMYAALASQKNYMSVYLTSVYADERGAAAFKAAYQATGKRLDMGKSCVRFKQIADLPLELIGEAIGSTPVSEFIGLMAGDA